MQLSKFTDYAFRVLIYMAKHEEELATVESLAKTLDVSEHHLKKVIHKLAKTDYMISIKGRSGGLRLGLPPEQINLGEVLRLTEDNLNIVGCFKTDEVCDFLNGSCRLKGIINDSLEQFIGEFGKYTLKDIL